MAMTFLIVQHFAEKEMIIDFVAVEVQPDVDPYELMDPVDIISKLPKDFYEKVVSWRLQLLKKINIIFFVGTN
jgi:hypothetical protein